MKRIPLIALAVLLGSVFLSCGKRPERVIIMSENGIAVFMQPEVWKRAESSKNPADEILPSGVKPNTILVYRVNRSMFSGKEIEVQGNKVEMGKAYRYDKEGKFVEIGTVDLNKSDDEIAEDFGIKRGSRALRMGNDSSLRRETEEERRRRTKNFPDQL